MKKSPPIAPERKQAAPRSFTVELSASLSRRIDRYAKVFKQTPEQFIMDGVVLVADASEFAIEQKRRKEEVDRSELAELHDSGRDAGTLWASTLASARQLRRLATFRAKHFDGGDMKPSTGYQWNYLGILGAMVETVLGDSRFSGLPDVNDFFDAVGVRTLPAEEDEQHALAAGFLESVENVAGK